MTDPVTFGTAVKFVYGLYTIVGGGGGRHPDILAAEAAGYRHIPSGPGVQRWRAPDGQILTSGQVRDIGYQLRFPVPVVATPPIAAPLPPTSSSPTIFDDLMSRPTRPRVPPPSDFEELLKKPRRRPPSDFEELLKKPRRAPAEVVSRAAVLSRVGSILAGVLYPSEIADSDLGYRAGDRGRGPPRRPRVRPRDDPQARPTAAPAPRVPARPKAPLDRPAKSPQTEARAVPKPRVLSEPLPKPRIGPIPRPATRVQPSPSPFPASFELPLLLPMLGSKSRPDYRGLTDSKSAPVSSARTAPSSLSDRAGSCPPCEPGTRRRKRKGKQCVNPITNKRTFTRDGATFKTVTRRIECQQ